MTDPISFEALQSLSYEQQRRWIERYYMQGAHDVVLRDLERSVILITAPGSGISTSFTVMEHYNAPTPHLPGSPNPIMFFRYEPAIWPGGPHALYQKDTVKHLPQLMVNFLERLLIMIKNSPERMRQIPLSGHEFIAWMVRHYHGVRRSERWFKNVEATGREELVELAARARAGEYDELHQDDILGCVDQIEECLELVTSLGMHGIYALAEITFSDWVMASADQREQWRRGLRTLLEGLIPLQTPRFGYKIAVPSAMINLKDARALVKDRAEVIEPAWTQESLKAMMERLAASDGPPITDLLSEADWQVIAGDCLSIWGSVGPAAMQAMAQWLRATPPLAAALNPDELLGLRRALYVAGGRLRYAPEQPQIVWRGCTRITLDETHIPVFQALWRHSQNRSFAQTQELLNSAGNSNANLDKIISRIRGRLEPFAHVRPYIYLERSQGLGVRLNYCEHP